MPPIPESIVFDYEQLDHAHLTRVVPLGITRTCAGVALSLMSLELYERGFIAAMLLEQADPQHPGGPEPLPLIFRAMPAITAQDDLGHTYAGHMRAGAGGGSTRGAQMRMLYTFTPALHEHAQTLAFEIEWVERLHWNADGSRGWGADEVIAGPDAIIVPIGGAPR
jgi:hypothetical protein